MTAYLIADVDDLLRFTARAGIDLQEFAVALRGSAALVGGPLRYRLLARDCRGGLAVAVG